MKLYKDQLDRLWYDFGPQQDNQVDYQFGVYLDKKFVVLLRQQLVEQVWYRLKYNLLGIDKE